MHMATHGGMPEVDGIEMMGEMLAHVKYGVPLSPQSAYRWEYVIVTSVRRGEPIDTTLGLAAAGRRTMQTRLLHMRRDEQLMQAVATVLPDPALSTWARCMELAPLLRAFVDREWPAVRTQANPRDDWPAWKAHLFRAMQQDLALPRSPRGLYDVVQRAQGYSTQKPGAKLLSQQL